MKHSIIKIGLLAFIAGALLIAGTATTSLQADTTPRPWGLSTVNYLADTTPRPWNPTAVANPEA